MSYSSLPARVKALERIANTSGPVVAILLPGDTGEIRAAKELMLAEAKAQRRETIRVDIRFRAHAPAEHPDDLERDGAPLDGDGGDQGG